MDIVDANDNNTVYAKGGHIKFLDMGQIWNTLFGKRFFNVTMTMIFALGLNISNSTTRILINKLLGIKKNTTNENRIHSEKDGGLIDNMAIASSGNEYKLTPRGFLNNPMGSMHGGAIACFVEHSNHHYTSNKDDRLKNSYVKKIETKYLSKSGGPIIIKDISLSPGDVSVGNVINERDESVIVQYKCFFAKV